MTNERLKSCALALTLLVHFGFIGGVGWIGNRESDRLHREASLQEEQFQHIEAGLAVKAKSSKGKKTKQPQKDTERKISPNDVVVSKDDQAKPPDDKKKKDERKPDDEVDPEAVFKKHREGAQGKASEDPSQKPGGDEETQEGSESGHEYGMFDASKGDPYLGELNGRVHANYEVPGTVPEGTGLRALGCVKLTPDGKIRPGENSVEDKSPNPAFNSAVLRSLKSAPDMEQPVPSHLTKLLVEQGICFEFRH